MTLRLTSPQAAMVSSRARVDRLHGPLEVALDHAVELEGLAGGQAQRAVGVGAVAMASMASHCSGVHTPPGTRTRIMKL